MAFHTPMKMAQMRKEEYVKRSPARVGVRVRQTRSIVLKMEFMEASLFESPPAITTIQSFSTTILEPMEARVDTMAMDIVRMAMVRLAASSDPRSSLHQLFQWKKAARTRQARATLEFCTTRKVLAAFNLAVSSIQLPMRAPLRMEAMQLTRP